MLEHHEQLCAIMVNHEKMMLNVNVDSKKHIVEDNEAE